MRETRLDQVELRSDGTIGVRLKKAVIDGGEEVAFTWHRTLIPVDVSVVDQMAAVNEHLAAMGYPPVSAVDIGYIETLKQAKK